MPEQGSRLSLARSRSEFKSITLTRFVKNTQGRLPVRWQSPLLMGAGNLLLPATMTSASATVEMTTMPVTVATMEVPTATEGEANCWPVPIVIRIGLIVVWHCVVAVPTKCPAAMPVAAMSPTTAAAAIVYGLDVGSMRHLQPRQTTDRPC
jgi:hypothetical protein